MDLAPVVNRIISLQTVNHSDVVSATEEGVWWEKERRNVSDEPQRYTDAWHPEMFQINPDNTTICAGGPGCEQLHARSLLLWC